MRSIWPDKAHWPTRLVLFALQEAALLTDDPGVALEATYLPPSVAARVLMPISRAVFADGRAECVICGAYVRPASSMSQRLIRRAFGRDAAVGECAVCLMVTYFALTP